MNAIMYSPFKALPLSLAILLAIVSVSYGQGEVDFENFNNSLISTSGGPTTGLISGAPGSYYFALLEAPINQTTVNSSLSGWGDVASPAINTATPGLIYGNDDPTGPGATLLVSPSGLPANFVVVGWSANIGNDWGLAQAWWNNGNPNSGPSGYFGISDIAQDVLVGGNPFPVPTIFGPTAGGEVQGFTLNYYAVPEPSIFALAEFGFIAALVLRRRK